MIHVASEFIDVRNPLNVFIFSILKVYSTVFLNFNRNPLGKSVMKLCRSYFLYSAFWRAMLYESLNFYTQENIFEEIMRDVLTLRFIGESNIYCRKLVIREGFQVFFILKEYF